MSKWKETEVGQIPIDWGVTTAHLFCKKVTDGTHDSPKQQNVGFPLITSKHIKGDNINFDDAYFISKEDYLKINQRSKVDQWDVIISMIGEYCGFSYLEENDNINYAIKNVGLFKTSNEIDAKWLYYYLQGRQAKHYINFSRTGTSQPYLTLGSLREFPIVIPSNSKEKENIVKTLDALRYKITLLRQQNQTLEELALTLFKRWFVDFEFPDENGQPYKSSGGKMIDSELGEIPVGWMFSTIGDNIETIGGGTPSTTEPTFWDNGEIFWYSPTDLTKEKSMYSIGSAKKITELGLQKSSAKQFSAYSLLMTSRATVGELTINIQPATTNQGFITLIPNENLSIHFLYVWLKSNLKKVHNLASGSTFPEISKTDFRNIEVIIATKKVHTEFDNIMNPIFKSIEKNTKEIQSLTELRDTLLPKLMSGELTINEL